VIIFNSLNKEDIFKIIDVELVHVLKRIEALGFKLTLSAEAKDFLAEKGFDPNFGARPLKRAIQKYLEDAVAEEIIKSSPAEGDTLEVTFDKEAVAIKINIIKATVPPPPAVKTRKKKEENNH
jgi:ATP-dependent Clp protease ATP-binding subunit ClpC